MTLNKTKKCIGFIFMLLMVDLYTSDKIFADGLSLKNQSDIQPPTLLSFQPQPYPVTLLKKGITGSVVIDLSISAAGTVGKVTIESSVHPILDSLASQAALKFRFKPAIENNKPVPVEFSIEYSFDPAKIVRNLSCSPNFTGLVKNVKTGEGISNAPVIIEFIDTLSDTACTIPFSGYITTIAQIPGQHLTAGTRMITRTDDSGHFSFHLLPVCSLKVRIDCSQYSFFYTCETIRPDEMTTVEYSLKPVGLP
jgi:TonB family protein